MRYLYLGPNFNYNINQIGSHMSIVRVSVWAALGEKVVYVTRQFRKKLTEINM